MWWSYCEGGGVLRQRLTATLGRKIVNINIEAEERSFFFSFFSDFVVAEFRCRPFWFRCDSFICGGFFFFSFSNLLKSNFRTLCAGGRRRREMSFLTSNSFRICFFLLPFAHLRRQNISEAEWKLKKKKDKKVFWYPFTNDSVLKSR